MENIYAHFICDLDDFKKNSSNELRYVTKDKLLAVLDKNKLFFYALHIEYFDDITTNEIDPATGITTVKKKTVYDENSMLKINLPDFKKKIKEIDEPAVIFKNGFPDFYIFPPEYVNFLF